jgi:hypothetical protein
MSFGLVDNLRVESFVSAPIRITGIKVVGANIEITFTGPVEAASTAFSLQEAAAVTGSYGNVSATITGGAGSFKAVRTLGSTPRFYRIRQN